MAKKSITRMQSNRQIVGKNNRAALFIPTGLFIGLGIGFLINNVIAGTLLGLGAGFLVFAIMSTVCKN